MIYLQLILSLSNSNVYASSTLQSNINLSLPLLTSFCHCGWLVRYGLLRRLSSLFSSLLVRGIRASPGTRNLKKRIVYVKVFLQHTHIGEVLHLEERNIRGNIVQTTIKPMSKIPFGLNLYKGTYT